MKNSEHTSINPPAIGNIVVTSPTLCMRAHTIQPAVFSQRICIYIGIGTGTGTMRLRNIPTIENPKRAPSGPERNKA